MVTDGAIQFRDDLDRLGLHDWEPPGSYSPAFEVWVSDSSVATSFPESGVKVFESVDDHSFWFDHRNWAIGHILEQEVAEAMPFLEVGSGSGVVIDHIRQTTNRPVISVEPILAGAIAVAKRGVRLSFCGSIESMKLPESRFAAVGAFDVVEHLDEPRPFLSECRRVLRPDGKLLLTVPAYQWLWSDFDTWNGHVQRFSMSALERLIDHTGFVIERRTHLFAPLVLPAIVTRIILPKLRRPHASGELESSVEESLAPSSRVVDQILRSMHRVERLAIRHTTVPFGTSILVAARPA